MSGHRILFKRDDGRATEAMLLSAFSSPPHGEHEHIGPHDSFDVIAADRVRHMEEAAPVFEIGRLIDKETGIKNLLGHRPAPTQHALSEPDVCARDRMNGSETNDGGSVSLLTSISKSDRASPLLRSSPGSRAAVSREPNHSRAEE